MPQCTALIWKTPDAMSPFTPLQTLRESRDWLRTWLARNQLTHKIDLNPAEPIGHKSLNRSVAAILIALCAQTWAVDAEAPTLEKIEPILENRCVECHDSDEAKGGLDLVKLPRDIRDPAVRERWIRIHDRIKAGEMPPKNEGIPDSERDRMITVLASMITATDRADVIQQGRGPMRRLTRVEFENNLRTLLKLPNLDISHKLPEDRESHGFTKVSALLDMSHVQLDAYLDATDTALRAAMAGPKPPAPAVTQRFTGADLFPSVSTFGGREAMFFARDSRMVPITDAELKAMSAEQRRDSTLELALFRSATWPYFGYPRGFTSKGGGAYRVRFKGRAVRQVRDFRLVPAHEPVPMSFRARKPSGPDVSGDVRETGGWMDLQPEAREFETTIHLKAGETFEYSPLGLPVPFIRTDGGFFYDYPPMPPEGHRGVAIQWLEVTGPIEATDWPPQSHRVLFDAVRETGGWMDLQPEAREFETTIHLKAGETFEYSPLGLPVPFIRTDGGFFYDYPPMPPEGHRGVAIQWLEVTGPIEATDWPPQSHRVLFDALQPGGGDAADAERLLRRFAALAALRPMSEEAHQPFLKLIHAKLAAGAAFADAMIAGYQALICSSYCLYLTEPLKENATSHFAIANRLSHFLWNSRLDDELAELARDGRLLEKTVLRAQTERLIEDSRFEQFVRTFADEWLDLRKLRRDIPDERLYPEYRKDDYLVDSMERETQTFLRAMVRENFPASTVVAAEFTFVNDRLAMHYDLPRVKGSAMRRVTLPEDSPFGGLVTQAGLLKHTANGTTTSPVLRGVWIMEKLLGQPVPPPPKDVPAIEPDIRGATTIRDLLAKHTESKSCASCHAKFDPVGFAMESFDVMGAWRDRYRGMERGDKITGVDPAGHPYTYFVGQPVDASGKLSTGQSFRDIHELKMLLAANPRQLAKSLISHLVLHATGTPVRFADRAEIDTMLDSCAPGGYRVRDLIHALVSSEIFLGAQSTP